MDRQPVLECVLRRGAQSARLVRVGEVARFPAGLARKEGLALPIEVRDPRVAEVDVAEVTATNSIQGVERLPETERTPAEPRSKAPSEAKAETEAPARPAKPSHQRRRIPRLRPIGPRYPSPASADIRPAAVVKGREAPRGSVHPGPAPRADPIPLTITVRRPARIDRGGCPHFAVIGIIFPRSVLVEIFGANHSRSHVTRGN